MEAHLIGFVMFVDGLGQAIVQSMTHCLLGPAPTGTGTIALDPTFASFTLLESVSH
jgi:hypothetical protein